MGAPETWGKGEPASSVLFETSCPEPGATVSVQPLCGSAFGAISAWVAYSCPPVAVRAHVYPDEIFNSLTLPVPFNANSVVAVRQGGMFSWAQVPGANFSQRGNVNYLVIWVQNTNGGPWVYGGNVVFSGVTCALGSGPRWGAGSPGGQGYWPCAGSPGGQDLGSGTGSPGGQGFWWCAGSPGQGLGSGAGSSGGEGSGW